MKKTIIASFLVLAFGAGTFTQVPTKLFDVRNGNGLTLDAVTYPRATAIVFRDNAAKNKVMDAFASAYGYQATIPNPNAGQEGQPATIPNPQTQQAFFNQQITRYIRDIVRSEEIKAAAKTAGDNAAATVDADLPNNN